MPILNLNHVSLYYEEFGRGDRYLIQAQQFVNSHIYYTKDLADRCGFHAFIIRIRGYAPSSMVTEDLGDDWYDVWAQDVVDFADAMGIEKFFYTGHSHGAGIGWHLCMNHPDRLRGFFASGSGPHLKDGKPTGSARMDTINAAKSRETWVPYAEKQASYCAKAFVPLESDPVIGGEAKKAADCGVLDQHARPVRCSQSPETLCKSSDRGGACPGAGPHHCPHHYDGRDRGQHQQPRTDAPHSQGPERLQAGTPPGGGPC